MSSVTAFCTPRVSFARPSAFFNVSRSNRFSPVYCRPARHVHRISAVSRIPDALPSLPAPIPTPTPTPAGEEPDIPPPTTYRVRDWTFRSFRVQYATALMENTTDSETDTEREDVIHNSNDENDVDYKFDMDKPAVIFVHGFGANCQHWRHNIRPLANAGLRAYALDLIGFGMGDKPAPGTLDTKGQPVEYTFDYWTVELRDFIDEVVEPTPSKRPVFLVANSVGCMVTMQYAVESPSRVAALTFISPSLRQLNVRKRSWVQDITAPVMMQLLARRPWGAFFLDSLSKRRALRKVLLGAYSVQSAVDDQLVHILRAPARTPGALDVFLSFISYDTGPIPEDWLPVMTQPALVLWGENDQFEPFELGQKLRHYSIVEQFIGLPNTGHCAHDERPEQCNKLIIDFFEKHKARTEKITKTNS